jgi:hypothetical protein
MSGKHEVPPHLCLICLTNVESDGCRGYEISSDPTVWLRIVDAGESPNHICTNCLLAILTSGLQEELL